MCVEQVIPLNPKEYEEEPAQEEPAEKEKEEEKIAEETREKKEPAVQTDDGEEEQDLTLSVEQIEQIMGNLMNVLADSNATSDALRERFRPSKEFTLDHAIPFSSDRKYSGASFAEKGTYLMGAAQFLFPDGNEKLMELCQKYAAQGYRLLLLAHSRQSANGSQLPCELSVCAV